ncbi:ABC transporter ATP-binding protein [Methyloligella sp. 2.7D]|uniref:ABC transporter ATP-binding protein n=1 Tax=unclassified Methyloligella TaxID=2625955 RepID=UPI00157E0022|nr:ABC transporter ATP-binding protein [Methyloligella sp. GL2]QKP77926.1 ABC transporter ATP-binding protein [Methyloligella sp. GL2]
MSRGLHLQGIEKRLGQQDVLRGIDLTAASGSYVVLLGPSGSGKTTLLNIVAGFEEADQGLVMIDDEDVGGLPPRLRPTATVFQDYALFPHMSVADNVGFGLRMHGLGKAERDRQVAEVLALVDLASFADRRIDQLSGGQRQRVAVARSLVVRPKVLLLDEPLGALDLSLRRQMQRELRILQKKSGTTFLHVTHDQEEAMSLADLLVVMNGGRIEDAGPPDRIFDSPASLFAATFVGENNVLRGRITSRAKTGTVIETALGPVKVQSEAPEGDEVYVTVRPNRLRLATPGSRAKHFLRGTVEEVTFLGTYYGLRVRTEVAPDMAFHVHSDDRTPPEPGAEIAVTAEPSAFSIIAAKAS